MYKVRVASLGLALLSTACVTSYKGVEPGRPFTVVAFTKGSEHQPLGGELQVYALSDDPKCEEQSQAAVLSWVTGNSREIQVASGRRTVVLAHTTFEYTTSTAYGPQFIASGCDNAQSFIPEVGHTYSVTQHANARSGCLLSISDSATGVAPPSLQVVDEIACKVI